MKNRTSPVPLSKNHCRLLTSPSLLDQLLRLVLTQPEEAAKTVATALRLTAYGVDLRSSITVDVVVEALHLCAIHRFHVFKTMAVLELIEAIRTRLVETQSYDGVPELVRSFYIQHASGQVRAAGRDCGAWPHADDDGKASISLAAPAVNTLSMSTAAGGEATAAVCGKKRGPRPRVVIDETVGAPPTVVDWGSQCLDLYELSVVGHHLAYGMLMHWRLFVVVSHCSRDDVFRWSSRQRAAVAATGGGGSGGPSTNSDDHDGSSLDVDLVECLTSVPSTTFMTQISASLFGEHEGMNASIMTFVLHQKSAGCQSPQSMEVNGVGGATVVTMGEGVPGPCIARAILVPLPPPPLIYGMVLTDYHNRHTNTEAVVAAELVAAETAEQARLHKEEQERRAAAEAAEEAQRDTVLATLALEHSRAHVVVEELSKSIGDEVAEWQAKLLERLQRLETTVDAVLGG